MRPAPFYIFRSKCIFFSPLFSLSFSLAPSFLECSAGITSTCLYVYYLRNKRSGGNEWTEKPRAFIILGFLQSRYYFSCYFYREKSFLNFFFIDVRERLPSRCPSESLRELFLFFSFYAIYLFLSFLNSFFLVSWIGSLGVCWVCEESNVAFGLSGTLEQQDSTTVRWWWWWWPSALPEQWHQQKRKIQPIYQSQVHRAVFFSISPWPLLLFMTLWRFHSDTFLNCIS